MFGTRKRTFNELQLLILKALLKDKLTIYEITKKTFLHFYVVQRQLILLKGADYISLEFEHNQFRLFAITQKGIEYLENKEGRLLKAGLKND